MTTLERSPKRDTVSFGSNNIAKCSDDILKKVFNFKLAKGKEFSGTVGEFLKKSIIAQRDTKSVYEIYHVPYTTDVGETIIKQGLNRMKNSRAQAGFGTYFSPSAGAGEFSGLGFNSIVAKYCGDKEKFPVFERGFFERLTEAVDISKEDYFRALDDMGIDFYYSATGRAGGAYVVINDKCMHLDKHGNW